MSSFSGVGYTHSTAYKFGYTIFDVIMSRFNDEIDEYGIIPTDMLSRSFIDDALLKGLITDVDYLTQTASLTLSGAIESLRLEDEIRAVKQFTKL